MRWNPAYWGMLFGLVMVFPLLPESDSLMWDVYVFFRTLEGH
jgi:hypothetical protein